MEALINRERDTSADNHVKIDEELINFELIKWASDRYKLDALSIKNINNLHNLNVLRKKNNTNNIWE